MLPFWPLFLAIIHRPHRSLGALYWYATRRRVRARKRLRLIFAESKQAYALWIHEIENLAGIKRNAITIIADWRCRPRISVILYVNPEDDKAGSLRSIRSVLKQIYGNWELILPAQINKFGASPEWAKDDRIRVLEAPVAKASPMLEWGIAAASGSFILPLRSGDELSPAALYEYVSCLQEEDQPALLYGDEDRKGWNGKRTAPYFKPDWNRELFLARDYISSAFLISTDAAREACPIAPDLAPVMPFALILNYLAKHPKTIPHHISKILCHRRKDSALGKRIDEEKAARLGAVNGYLAATNSNASAQFDKRGAIHVLWPLPEKKPLVSLIVPTRDKLNLLAPCIDGLLNRTGYSNIEIIIIDNDSLEDATHRYFEQIENDERIRVLPFQGAYNYSAINNFAVRAAKGDYIGLINNDTEVIETGWLDEMMRHAVRPHVGAVGAKLLYESRKIQHAGVIIGLGGTAGHAHRLLPDTDPGYFDHPHLPQYMTAVTAACLILSKEKFEAVGGLDEENLPVAFNDVDLCLKLTEAGYRNVYTPHAILFHYESKSRGSDISKENRARHMREIEYMQRRWGTKTYRDSFHNDNLSKREETFLIGL